MMDEAARRRTTRMCLRVMRGTAWAADRYELRLLVQFIRAELTIEQVIVLLDKRTA